MKDKEVEKVWREFWKPLVFRRGKLDIEAVKRELFDYHMVLGEVPKVYDHITNGRISKPQTRHEDVIAVADDVVDELVACEMEEFDD